MGSHQVWAWRPLQIPRVARELHKSLSLRNQQLPLPRPDGALAGLVLLGPLRLYSTALPQICITVYYYGSIIVSW